MRAAVAGLICLSLWSGRALDAARPAVGIPIAELAEACFTSNPYFATTAFAPPCTQCVSAVIAFRKNLGDGRHYTLATQSQVGSVYGLAIRDTEPILYAAAYLKRGAPYGPSGPGQIYRIDVATGAVSPFVRVANSGGDPHDRPRHWPDLVVVDQAGKSGLGDIDIEENGSELFAMNLADRRIYRYRMSGPAFLDSFAMGAAAEPWAADARPFGLKIYHGKVYHGLVNSAEGSQNAADLRAYVYRSDYDGSNMQRVVDMPLGFERGRAVNTAQARWLPWQSTYRSLNLPGEPAAYPQPILSDIEFSTAGVMILGFRDRFGDMTYDDPPAGLPPGEDRGVGVGDIVRTLGFGGLVDPEHFAQDAGPGVASVTGAHDETGNGGLARLPITDEIVTSALTPYRSGSGGALWFSVGTGRNTIREELYRQGEGYATFGEANGHGDVERLCAAVVPPQPTDVPRRTPTPTATRTATRTATATWTVTSSATASPTPTDTATATATATPSATPTATATWTPSATFTVTPSDTPTPTHTVTRTPTRTATATPAHYEVYLPGLRREPRCVGVDRHADVVLVLDRSTSMLRSVRAGGMAKNDAAIAAARAFIGRLSLLPTAPERSDQVALVGFNDRGWVESQLTRNRAGALAALDRLASKLAEGTRLDLAFSTGQLPLDGPGRLRANRPVLIVLTDGLPNRVPFPPGGRQEDTVLAAAAAVKARGSRVYTVGLGGPADISVPLLRAAASEPSMAYVAPDSSDLAVIYAEIARREVQCR